MEKALIGVFTIALIIVCIAVGVFFLLRFWGYKKAAIIISSLLLLIVLVPFFSFLFESELYFKSDAKDDLKVLNLKLQDDFIIVHNKIGGLMDYVQMTHLKISSDDRNRFVKEIQSSKDFKEIPIGSLPIFTSHSGLDTMKKVWNYRVNSGLLFREYYEYTGAYAPLFYEITINPMSDTVYLFIKR